MSVIGIDIGGTKCAVIKTDVIPEDGSPPEYSAVRFPTTTRDETLSAIFRAVSELSAGADPLFGISCGDPQDARHGLILSPPNLPGWDAVPITTLLTDRFGGRAYLMNDANAGALAEWRFGAARGCDNVVFLTHGTGMGAGLILNGQLYEGTTYSAGEVGHVRLAESGPVGYGKAGSFEGFTSGGGIARMAKERARASGGNPAFNPTGDIDAITAKDVGQAAFSGDKTSRDILAESGKYLGRGLAMIIDVLNPDIIVLGSLYGRIGEFLEPAMRAELEKECLPHALAACRIVPAGLGEAIGDYATLAVALYRSQEHAQG